MLRGAIVGFGRAAASTHLPVWLRRQDLEIVAAADTRAEQRDVLRTHLPGARWYDVPVDLMDRETLHFVDICTPPASHPALVQAALERGLHVLCEKPLVCSLDDLPSLTRLAVATGRVLHTVHNWHHAPIIRQTRELVRQGAIGHVRHVVWDTLRTRPASGDGGNGDWRVDPTIAGGGVLTDHGWHAFYIVTGWIGQTPTAVNARLETRRHVQWPVEDTATVRLTFPEATAEILLTWAADVRRNWAELTGDEGTLRLEDDILIMRRPGRPPHEQRWRHRPPLSEGGYHPDWFERVADHFLAAINGAAPRAENLAEASLCAMLESLARESSRQGQTVSLSVPIG